jgi:hypothetical protein
MTYLYWRDCMASNSKGKYSILLSDLGYFSLIALALLVPMLVLTA